MAPTLQITGVQDPDGRSVLDYLVTVTATDAPEGHEALVRFGDGSPDERVAIDAAGTATVKHTYPYRRGATKYPLSARMTLAVRTWADVPGLAATWADVPPMFATWEELSGVLRAQTFVTVVAPDILLIAAPAYMPPTVEVTVHAASGAWKLERLMPDGTSVVIFTGNGLDGSIIVDTLAPLNTPLRYRLNGSTESNQVTLTGPLASGCWLTSLVTGQTVKATVQTWDSQRFAARQSLLPIPGRTDPVVIYDKHLMPETSIVFRTENEDGFDAVEAILLSGHIILRTQPASSLRTTAAIVGQIEQARLLTGDGSSWLMQHAAALQTIPIDYSRSGRVLT